MAANFKATISIAWMLHAIVVYGSSASHRYHGNKAICTLKTNGDFSRVESFFSLKQALTLRIYIYILFPSWKYCPYNQTV